MHFPILRSHVLRLALVPLAFLFLAALLASPAQAASIDGWYYHGDSLTFLGVNYTLKAIANYQAVRLVSANGSFSIQNGSCYDADMFTACYKDTDFSTDRLTVDLFGNVLGAIHMVFNDKTSSIAIASSVSQSSPLFGAPFNVSVQVQNNGNFDASALHYEAMLPSSVQFVEGAGAYYDQGKAQWDLDSLLAGKSASFSYSAKMLSYGERQLPGKFTYITHGKVASVDVTPLSVKVGNPYSQPYTFTQSLSPSSVQVDDPLTWTLAVHNSLQNETMNVSLVVQIPANVAILAVPEGLVSDKPRTYRYAKALDGLDDASIVFRLQARTSGASVFSGALNVSGKDLNFNAPFVLATNFTNTLQVSIPGIQVRVTPARDAIAEGESVHVAVSIQNPSDVTFSALSGILNVGFASDSVERPTIASNDLSTFEKTYIIPENSSRLNITSFNFTATYRTPNGEVLTLKASAPVRIYAPESALGLAQHIDHTTIKRGDSFSVSASAEDLLDIALGPVAVHDEFPGTLTFVSGVKDGSLTLPGGQESQAYSYVLQVPQDFEYHSFYVKTYAKLAVAGQQVTVLKYTQVTVQDAPAGAADEPAPQAIVARTGGAGSGSGANSTIANASAPGSQGGAQAGAGNGSLGSGTLVPAEKSWWTKFIDFITGFFK